jgi:hypothetical protein
MIEKWPDPRRLRVIALGAVFFLVENSNRSKMQLWFIINKLVNAKS